MGVAMGEMHLSCQKGASGAGAVPYLLRKAPTWRKGHLFVSEGRIRWREGTHIMPAMLKSGLRIQTPG